MTFGLDEQEPDAQDFDDQNNDIYEVELPMDPLQADGIDVLIEDLEKRQHSSRMT